ncbi:MAG: hypothetical protein RL748_4035 [Pseudomonadota bacterium]|jgi:ribosomal-protein-alanine N-acetyltransferase
MRLSQIDTPRCLLRPASNADLPAMAQALADPRFPQRLPLAAMQRNGKLPDWLHKMRASQTHGAAALWSIDLKIGVSCIGQLGLFDRGDLPPALSFWLAPAHWGQGLAGEAAAAFLAHAQEQRQLSTLWASTAQWNLASQHLLAALGFVPCGQNPAGYLVDGVPEATLEYLLA